MDISSLSINESDKRLLREMGFFTLEQLARADKSDLGMGRKGDNVIRQARNILFNNRVRGLEVVSTPLQECITVQIDEFDGAILEAVKGVLGAEEGGPDAYTGNSVIKVSGNKIEIYDKGNPRRSFKPVLAKAKRWSSILEESRLLREMEERREKGITLDEEEIVRFAKERGFDGFWKNFFEEIRGNELTKKCVTISLFSGFEEPVHTLILGDPASSKTLIRDLLLDNLRGSGITSIGANATRSGLVCNLATGDLGALAYSDRKLVVVDELDKIPSEDVEYSYELLSNGRCSIHSAKVHKELESHFTMIAFANPQEKIFGKRPIDGIGLSPMLMSRFGLIVKTEELSEDERKDLYREKIFGGGELRRLPQYYDQWVKLAKGSRPDFVVSDGAIDEFVERADEIYKKHKLSPLRRDLRMGDYLRRIPMAIARAEFRDVDDPVLERAIEILEGSIEAWG
jgi:hypothetical protein